MNRTGKKVAVIGSRTCLDKEMVYALLDKNEDRISMIVSGGAKGADTLATQWAHERGVPYLVFPARWYRKDGTLDKGAGFRRNRDIIQESDYVIAFWDGVSRGTANSMSIAEQLKKPLKVVKFEAPPKVVKKKKVQTLAENAERDEDFASQGTDIPDQMAAFEEYRQERMQAEEEQSVAILEDAFARGVNPHKEALEASTEERLPTAPSTTTKIYEGDTL